MKIFDDREAQTRAFLSFYVADMASRVLLACQREKCVLCSEHTILLKAGGANTADCKRRTDVGTRA